MFKTQYKDSQFELTQLQIEKLLNATENFRDKLIIESLYFPALRREEVVNLRIENIDFENQRLVVQGKFDKVAPIPVGALFPQYLYDLKRFIGDRRSGIIFKSSCSKYTIGHNTRIYTDKPLNVSRINQILEAAGDAAGLKSPNPKKKHINPHLLRHSLSRHLKNMGLPGEFIQNYLRHESITTTMDNYGTLSINEMESLARQLRGEIPQEKTNIRYLEGVMR